MTKPIRPWALPLVPLYRAATAAKNAAYDRQILRPKTLSQPVLSVGSLSAGGAGKTPVVLMLAGLLAELGIATDVLSRGYGRRSSRVEQVDSQGTAAEFGDEPLELAQAGLRVFVGADRFAAGTLAERSSPRIHLLDDGFQHRRLHRSLDIVLLTQADVEDTLLPAGNLREPLTSLSRAQAVVLRQEESASLIPVVQAHAPHAAIWLVRRQLTLPPDLPRRPLAFCGIARPQNFFAMLSEAGCTPAATLAFHDHHPYTAADADRILAQAKQAGANGLITTVKDHARLSVNLRQTLAAAGPLMVARLQAVPVDYQRLLADLQAHLSATQDSRTRG